MNKKQKLFWDLLSKNYPPESERGCSNCMHLSRPYEAPPCCLCRSGGGGCVVGRGWEWDGKDYDEWKILNFPENF